jgi:hypothetical protein
MEMDETSDAEACDISQFWQFLQWKLQPTDATDRH